MTRILILFAHPALEKSRIHRQLLRGLPELPGVTLNDLYERYPDFDIDIAREQQLLTDHDLVILQHPFYWYSTPALLKQWQDLVLEHGWAYGSQGKALRGKQVLSVISTGGGAAVPHGRLGRRHLQGNAFRLRKESPMNRRKRKRRSGRAMRSMRHSCTIPLQSASRHAAPMSSM